jgi:hypothetical protein
VFLFFGASSFVMLTVSPWGVDGGDDAVDEEPPLSRGSAKGNNPVAPWLKGNNSNSAKAATSQVDADIFAARKAITSANIELRHPQAGRRKRDEWEEAYDRGKVKKVKTKVTPDQPDNDMPRAPWASRDPAPPASSPHAASASGFAAASTASNSNSSGSSGGSNPFQAASLARAASTMGKQTRPSLTPSKGAHVHTRR